MTGEARPRVVIVGGGFAGLVRVHPGPAPERTFTSRDVGVVRDVYGEDLATMIAATNTASPPAPPDPAGSAGPGKPARGRQ